eukprot:scaffold950_cov360-Pavlova_lutheri.AAC.28
MGHEVRSIGSTNIPQRRRKKARNSNQRIQTRTHEEKRVLGEDGDSTIETSIDARLHVIHIARSIVLEDHPALYSRGHGNRAHPSLGDGARRQSRRPDLSLRWPPFGFAAMIEGAQLVAWIGTGWDSPSSHWFRTSDRYDLDDRCKPSILLWKDIGWTRLHRERASRPSIRSRCQG